MLESKLISEEKQKQTKKIEELFILSLLYLLKMSKFKSYRLSTHIYKTYNNNTYNIKTLMVEIVW